MRNCLPKFSRVFRRKSSSAKSGRENPSSEPDSDGEPYTAVIRPTALSDPPCDNNNESSPSRLISPTNTDLDLDLNVDLGVPAINGGIQGSWPEMKVETISAATAGTIPSPGPASVAISQPFGGRNSGKTPEEIELEYEENVKAEGRDIVTPLRRNTRPLSVAFSGSGRSALQPEIAEVIRSLDVPALLLNNLSLDTKNRECEREMECYDHEDSVVLRRKANCLERKTRSLYERRLPKVPKLHLQVAGKKPTEEEEFRIFQVQLTKDEQLLRLSPSICRLSHVSYGWCVLENVVIHFRLHFHSSD
ncbi:LOW QUALITY PROTEIN: uncharacterized protein Dana_GF26676 [Drosophila ananassae]|uniref:Uncharacterized protein n=1 Tax=Drosophila ananassae TaxID=7217 RepID=A0A0P9AEF5_DROAN|nr:LOW QUALITY PROTEIN: uncharacterized protein Dana_GF26676 [Drosophila ananassae]